MLVLLAKTKTPNAKETVEALCDAILRRDKSTQKDLTSFEDVPGHVLVALEHIKHLHVEQAVSYQSTSIKKWDSEDASFENVQVECRKNEFLIFECRSTLNQWTIIDIKEIPLLVELSEAEKSVIRET